MADQEEVQLRLLFSALWSRKLFIAIVTTIVTIACIFCATIIPKSYKTSIVLAVVSNSSNGNPLGGLGSIASQFGGLASLAGLSIGADTGKSESIAVLKSQALTQKYISEKGLLPTLYSDQWDAKSGKWKVTGKQPPTLWAAAVFFNKEVRVVETDPKTGLLVMTVEWSNPQLAATWANELVKVTNEYLRAQAIKESERNIAYLNSEALKTSIVGAREAIYKILETEINKGMIARGTDEFAFKVLDPAVPPEKPASPRKLLWALGGFLGGLFFSVFSILVHAASRPTLADR